MGLSITRKLNETLLIGDDIRIVVTRLTGRQVILNVTAPDSVRIDRPEARRAREERERREREAT